MAGKIERSTIPQIGEKSFQGNILPGGDGQFDIGSSGKRWRRIFVKELVASQVTGVTVTGEDVDTVDGLHASATPEAGKLLALNGSSVFPDSVYPNAILADGTIDSALSTDTVFIDFEKLIVMLLFTGMESPSVGLVETTVGANDGIGSVIPRFETVDSFQYLFSVVAP